MGNEVDDLINGFFSHQRRQKMRQAQEYAANLEGDYNTLVDEYNALLEQYRQLSDFLQKVRDNEARVVALSHRQAALSNRLSSRLWRTINEENRLDGLAEERIVDARRRRLEHYKVALQDSGQAPLDVLRDINAWTVASAVACYRLIVVAKQKLRADLDELERLLPELRAERQTEANYQALEDLVRKLSGDATDVLGQDVSGRAWRLGTLNARTNVDDAIRGEIVAYARADSALLVPLLEPAAAKSHVVDVLARDYGRVQRYLIERGRVPAADPLPPPNPA